MHFVLFLLTYPPKYIVQISTNFRADYRYLCYYLKFLGSNVYRFGDVILTIIAVINIDLLVLAFGDTVHVRHFGKRVAQSRTTHEQLPLVRQRGSTYRGAAVRTRRRQRQAALDVHVFVTVRPTTATDHT